MKDNIIDLSERMTKPEEKSRLKDLKLRIDLEQAKALVSTSLISVLFLVTLANNSLLTPKDVQPEGSAELSSVSGKVGGRGPDAVMTGTSDMEDELAHRLAKMSLKETAGVGRAPTALQKLTLGYLEGKYAVRLQNGKLRELEFAELSQTTAKNSAGLSAPKLIADRARFLEENRELLPVGFDKLVKVESSRNGEDLVESYDLVNRAGIPVGKARFQIDAAGRLISMKVLTPRLAAN